MFRLIGAVALELGILTAAMTLSELLVRKLDTPKRHPGERMATPVVRKEPE